MSAIALTVSASVSISIFNFHYMKFVNKDVNGERLRIREVNERLRPLQLNSCPYCHMGYDNDYADLTVTHHDPRCRG